MANYFKIPDTKGYQQNMDSMIDQAKYIAGECEDIITDKLFVDGQGVHLGNNYDVYEPTEWALGQLCSRVGFYRKQYQKFKEFGMEHMNYMNLNALINRKPREYFMRTYQDKLRAVLTPRYEVFDTPQILDVINEGINRFGDTSELLVQGSYQTFEQFHARLTYSEPIKGVSDKDLFSGVTIDTSDVGGSALHVRYFIYKQVCTNGLSLPVFDNELVYCTHKGLMAQKVLEQVQQAFVALKSADERARTIITRSSHYKVDLKEAQKMIMRDFTLSNKEYENVVELTHNYENNAWGFTNAITEFAQSPNVEFNRRLRLERLAGDFMLHPSRYAA